MNQPDLGKKIAELRKAKGLTQEELVEKCNLNVRTLQRIESGDVSPRSYTIKTIFAALDYEIYNSSSVDSESGNTQFTMYKLPGQLCKYLFDLFNLKTNTMKKISILTIAIFTAIFLFFTAGSESNAQTPAEVKRIIKNSNENFIRWFNAKQIDSLITLYRDDACLVGMGCGKTFISGFYGTELKSYKLKNLSSLDINVSDSIAIEKGRLLLTSGSGEELEGEYLTEWRLTNKKWLVFSDATTLKKK